MGRAQIREYIHISLLTKDLVLSGNEGDTHMKELCEDEIHREWRLKMCLSNQFHTCFFLTPKLGGFGHTDAPCRVVHVSSSVMTSIALIALIAQIKWFHCLRTTKPSCTEA